jgi:hypothetical protein
MPIRPQAPDEPSRVVYQDRAADKRIGVRDLATYGIGHVQCLDLGQAGIDRRHFDTEHRRVLARFPGVAGDESYVPNHDSQRSHGTCCVPAGSRPPAA